MKPISSATTEVSLLKQPTLAKSPRTTQFSLPTPRWTQIFVTDRLFRKSFHAAELAIWQATGGDFLRTAHA